MNIPKSKPNTIPISMLLCLILTITVDLDINSLKENSSQKTNEVHMKIVQTLDLFAKFWH